MANSNEIKLKCSKCKLYDVVFLNDEHFELFKKGKSVREAFPYMPNEDWCRLCSPICRGCGAKRLTTIK